MSLSRMTGRPRFTVDSTTLEGSVQIQDERLTCLEEPAIAMEAGRRSRRLWDSSRE